MPFDLGDTKILVGEGVPPTMRKGDAPKEYRTIETQTEPVECVDPYDPRLKVDISDGTEVRGRK